MYDSFSVLQQGWESFTFLKVFHGKWAGRTQNEDLQESDSIIKEMLTMRGHDFSSFPIITMNEGDLLARIQETLTEYPILKEIYDGD